MEWSSSEYSPEEKLSQTKIVFGLICLEGNDLLIKKHCSSIFLWIIRLNWSSPNFSPNL